ncbi:hypothetical protein BDR06DRAFT_1003401 [Suillus hirtellus]|nr:hypothetical protein BDR06DRAFT_1003401 [Suillus hirtellus]
MSQCPVHKQGSRIHNKPIREDDLSISKTAKALAAEVRMRLVEVDKLCEDRRNIQHEPGYPMMMMMKTKYGPGGWKLPMPGPVGSDPPPSPEVPPPPPEPPCPVWRTLRDAL